MHGAAIIGTKEEGDSEILNSLSVFPSSLFDRVTKEAISNDIVEALYAHAYSHYQIGKYNETLMLFRLLTGLRHRDPRFWKGMGSTLQMLKNFGEAVEAYSCAALFDEKQLDPHPHFHGAECLYSIGKVATAIKALDSARLVARKNEQKFAQLLKKISFLRLTWSKKLKRKTKGMR